MLLFAAVATASGYSQSAVALWDFTSTANGTTTGIAATSTAANLTVSNLNSSAASGNVNPNVLGVVDTLLGSTLASAASANPSAVFDGKAFEIGMKATNNNTSPLATDHSLNFTLQVASEYVVQLTSLTLDLGYDTSATNVSNNFVRPYMRLYYSLNGVDFTALGSVIDPGVTNTAAFSSTKSHYIGDNLSVSFAGDTAFSPDGGTNYTAFGEETTLYFRLAFADGSSNVDTRAILVDQITLYGTVAPAAVPEPSTYALIVAAISLGVAVVRKRRQSSLLAAN